LLGQRRVYGEAIETVAPSADSDSGDRVVLTAAAEGAHADPQLRCHLPRREKPCGFMRFRLVLDPQRTAGTVLLRILQPLITAHEWDRSGQLNIQRSARFRRRNELVGVGAKRDAKIFRSQAGELALAFDDHRAAAGRLRRGADDAASAKRIQNQRPGRRMQPEELAGELKGLRSWVTVAVAHLGELEDVLVREDGVGGVDVARPPARGVGLIGRAAIQVVRQDPAARAVEAVGAAGLGQVAIVAPGNPSGILYRGQEGWPGLAGHDDRRKGRARLRLGSRPSGRVDPGAHSVENEPRRFEPCRELEASTVIR
jgi:hypothetical protein